MKQRASLGSIERRDVTAARPDVTDEGKIRGLAIPFEQWTTIGSGKMSFREKVSAGAVTKTFQEGDIVLLDNHDPAKPIARKSAGTLEAHAVHGEGARYVAQPADTTYAHDVVENIRAGNYGGMSFGFEVVKERWAIGDDGVDERTLLEIKVPELSVCTFPAYDGTEVGMRDAYTAGIEARDRYYGKRAAKATYADLDTCADCGSTGQYGAYCSNCGEPMHPAKPSGEYCSSCGAPLDNSNRSSHVCETRGGDAPGNGKKPYGNVTYADPGYQSDKKKRYPINTANHVKAAWSYINKAKNAGRYTASQLAAIKAKIKSAAKKFGITISSDRSFADFDLRGYDPVTGFETRDDPDGKEYAAMHAAIMHLNEGDPDAAREALEMCLENESYEGEDAEGEGNGAYASGEGHEDSGGMVAHTEQGGAAVPVRSGGQLGVVVEARQLQRAYDLIRSLSVTPASNEALDILAPLLEAAEKTPAAEGERGKPKPESSTSGIERDSDTGRTLAREWEALSRKYR